MSFWYFLEISAMSLYFGLLHEMTEGYNVKMGTIVIRVGE